MANRLIIIGLLLINIFMFTSCLTIETSVTINSDLSGTAIFNYSVSTLAADIGKIDRDNKVLPFPINQEDFDVAADKAGGIEIIRYENDLGVNGTRYNIEGEISFDSLDSFGAFCGTTFSVVPSGNNQLLTVLIQEADDEKAVTEQTMNIVRDNFPDDQFSFIITIPGDIVQVNGATFSGSDVRFNISVEELVQSTENIQFTVEYR